MVTIWYVRRNDEVTGPFPAGLITRYILLGRIRRTDEVSIDKVLWRPVQDVPELIPDVLKADPEDVRAHERLEAARRWADERPAQRRHEDVPQLRQGSAADRQVAVQSLEEVLDQRRPWVRFIDNVVPRTPMQRMAVGVGGMIMVVLLAAVSLVQRPFDDARPIDCNAAPVAGVNWSYCQMQGVMLEGRNLTGAQLRSANLFSARLRGANLSGADLGFADLSRGDLGAVNFIRASLTGANLQESDLGGSDFSNADLSYANLRGANVNGARFDGARLDKAIWVDGTTCAVGSTGACRH